MGYSSRERSLARLWLFSEMTSNTLPDFPAEIRAHSGTIAGISGFQIHFGSTKIEKQPRYEAVFLSKFYFKTAKAFS